MERRDACHGTRESRGPIGLISRSALCVAVVVPLALLAVAAAFPATITSISGKGIGWADNLPYCSGSFIMINGSGFVTDGGVTSVSIGGVPAKWFSVGQDNTVFAVVGAGATTGNVVVTTPKGPATSPTPFGIFPCASSGASALPVVTSAPKKAKGGHKIQLLGSGFIGTTSVTVGGASTAYAIPSDVNMYVVIPASVSNGTVTIVITNAKGSTKVTVNKVS